MTKKTTIYLDFVHDLGGGQYKLEGYLGGREVSLSDVLMYVDGERVYLEKVERIQSQDGLELHEPIAGSAFEARFQIDATKTAKIHAKSRNKRIKIKANRYTGLSKLLLSYRIYDKTIWVLSEGAIRLYPNSRGRRAWFELNTHLSILLNWRILDALQKANSTKTAISIVKATGIVAEAIIKIPEAIALRFVYLVKKPRLKRPIWIISDRVTAGGDNGEALFRYIAKEKSVPADVYFVIDRKSPDYSKLKKVGKVLRHGSFKYKLFFLLSDKVISSHADIWVINPFLRQVDRYAGLFKFDFVFLQHGVIRHDLSGWLNRYNRNIRLFITSSEAEKKSILANKYYYQEENIALSGLPRYDLLRSEPKNKLILAPTYRKSLISAHSNNKGDRKYDSTFKNAEYFQFYNRFMNDPELLEALKEKNMTGELYLHPIFAAQAKDFQANTIFKIMSYPYNYSEAFREGNLLVSDHSSVTFDFAYLKKPVLYAHFDAEKFYAGHTFTKSNLFDDEKDGFGPVCPDYKTLVGETIKLIKSGSTMPDKYRERVASYFKYTDRHNAERVYRAILKLDEES